MGAYQNVNKHCDCETSELQQFLTDKSTIAVNNLGGMGPDTKLAEEMRFAKVAQDAGKDYFDVVARVAPGSTYKSIYADVRNGPNGKLGEINIDVPVTASNGGLVMTTFEFEIQDSITGDPLVMDEYFVSFFDLDVNKQMNLHERICIDFDQFDEDKSTLPKGGDVKVTTSDLKTCDGKASKTGSVLLESQGVGFLCDNPKQFDDLADITCDKCFNKQQCAKANFSRSNGLSVCPRLLSLIAPSSLSRSASVAKSRSVQLATATSCSALPTANV